MTMDNNNNSGGNSSSSSNGYKYTIRFTGEDLKKVEFLKKKFGYKKTSELIRFLITVYCSDARS